jgi:hypothetical protein
MNMFRSLFALFLIAFAIGLVFGNPDGWTWWQRLGPSATSALSFCVTFKPFVVGGCIVVALAIFMTRKQY